MLPRRLEPGGSIYMFYGVSYHMFAFKFERGFTTFYNSVCAAQTILYMVALLLPTLK